MSFAAQFEALRATLHAELDEELAGVTLAPARVALDGAMTSGSAVLTSPTAAFTTADVGAVIAVYEAGPLTNGYRQPLSSTIVSIQSATQATLAHPAQATVAPSSRAVWGADRTAEFQARLNVGGSVMLSSGHHMVRALTVLASGTTLRGAGIGATTLENWDVEADHALLEMGPVGVFGEVPEGQYTTDLALNGLTLRQVDNPTNTIAKVVLAEATDRVVVSECEIIGRSYEGLVMAGNSRRWVVRDNVATTACGFGGPGYSNTTSAYNLNGVDIVAERNVCRNAGQAFEIGGRRVHIAHNEIGPDILQAINIGSSSNGVWDITVTANRIEGGNVVASNSLGSLNRVYVFGNRFINATVSLDSGKDVNSFQWLPVDTVIHGLSLIADNDFTVTNPAAGELIFLGGMEAWSGQEVLIVASNRVIHQPVLEAPVLTAASLRVPAMVRDLAVTGPGTSGRDIKVAAGMLRANLRLSQVKMAFDWRIQVQGDPNSPYLIAANTPYSD